MAVLPEAASRLAVPEKQREFCLTPPSLSGKYLGFDALPTKSFSAKILLIFLLFFKGLLFVGLLVFFFFCLGFLFVSFCYVLLYIHLFRGIAVS